MRSITATTALVLAGLEPPEQLEGPAQRFVDGARRQADELERLADATGEVTVAQLADAVEQGATAAPLRELAAHGIVEPPGH